MNKDTDVTTITREQYYMLLGLRVIADDLHKQLKALERAGASITGEQPDDNMNGQYFGHTSDWIYGTRDTDDMLRVLEIKVQDAEDFAPNLRPNENEPSESQSESSLETK